MMLISIINELVQTVSNEPNMADWLQGYGTVAAVIIAIPGTVAAFIVLFRKDKDKQKQIDKLTSIVDELKTQTMEFSLQTEQMREYNKILKDQLDLQLSIQSGNKEYQTQMAELKKKELKSRNKPRFIFSGEASSGPNQIRISIKNVGETAILLDFGVHELKDINVTTPKNTIVPKQGTFWLTADYVGQENVHNIFRCIQITFKDSIDSLYRQDFTVHGNKVEIGQIIEITV